MTDYTHVPVYGALMLEFQPWNMRLVDFCLFKIITNNIGVFRILL